MNDLEQLKKLLASLAPYILNAQALIWRKRKVGGNQFRHGFNTLGILLDYQLSDPILLKASVIHDLIEEVPATDIERLRRIDEDANCVVDLVLEVSKREDELKYKFLERILTSGSINAKLLKCADRISNLTDLHRGIFKPETISKYLDETEMYIIPMAKQVNLHMVTEISDLIEDRNLLLKTTGCPFLNIFRLRLNVI
jgi:(p)ppGpp synthase/HD superfamily hydrolase